MSTTDVGATGSTPVAAPPVASTNTAAASKDMFLKLLVAQLSHQDPLTPADGTQFVTQLAQFTTLEQSTQMGQDISAIRAALTANATSTSASTSTSDSTQKSSS